MNSLNTYQDNFRILLFNHSYQSEVTKLMTVIQTEFHELFSTPESKTITQLTETNGDIFWVALHENRLIGTVGLSRFNNKQGLLKRLFVAKEFRGHPSKISQRLLDTAVKKAKELDLTEIYLGTMIQFIAAQNFYLKNGFVQIPSEDLPDPGYLSSLDRLFYKLKL